MPEQTPYISLLYYILPSFILDSFDLVNVDDKPVDNPTPDLLYPSVLHLYLDERDNRTEEQSRMFKPNGFTEPTQVQDFPIRDRKTVLHIRRRYLDDNGKGVLINNFNLSAQGTRYSDGFADFVKRYLDTYPGTAKSVGRRWMVDGSGLERNYKDSLGDFRQWRQPGHAADWMLLPQNMGVRLGIDGTSLCDDLFTILSNKDWHGRKGTVIAMVRGTRCSDVAPQLMKIPLAQRLAVAEVTMDFSDSMYAIVRQCFPNATIVIDCFHIVKRCGEAIEELRLKAKRQAQKEKRKLQAEHRKKQAARVKARKAYRKKHPKKYKGKIPGRKPARLNSRYIPGILSNGDTKVELLTRSRNLLSKSPDKWSDTQKERARLVFDNRPEIKEDFSLINSLRAIFRNKDLDRDQARTALHSWYDGVAKCTLREVKSARDAIRTKEEEVLNYFIDRSTNASAESLKSKLKGFRSQPHGVADLSFFMYRVSRIFG